MSHLVEALGRGLVGDLFEASSAMFPAVGETSTEQLLEQVREEKSDPDAQVRLACSLMADSNNSNTGLARDLFENVVRHDPCSTAGHLGLACVADRLGHNSSAEHHLEKAIESRPDDPVLMFALGVTYEKLGQLDRAERTYEDTLRTCPGLRNARERLAAVQLVRGELDASARHYTLLRAARPDQITGHLILANLHLARGDASAAAETFEDALRVEADYCECRDDEASVLESRGEYEQAILWLEQAANDETANADLHLRLGDLLVRAGRNDDALGEYLRAVEISPEFLEASVKAGTHFLRLGRYDQASGWFTRAVEVNDRLITGYIGLSVAQEEAGDRSGCNDTLEMAASIEPNSTLLFSEAVRLSLKAGALQGIGGGGVGTGEFDDQELEAMAEQAVMVSTVSQVVELLDTVIDRLEKWTEQRPNHAQAHYRRAMLLRNRGRIDEANAALTRAVQINPAYSKALIKLGLGLREVGRPDEASRRFREALGYEPHTVRLHHQLALMFTQQPRFEIACHHFTQQFGSRALEIDPAANLSLALENLGLVTPVSLFGGDFGMEVDRFGQGRGGGRW